MPPRKRICPKCGSNNTVKMVYGYPAEELMETARRGEVCLGGCCVGPNNPTYSCKECDYSWGGNSETKLLYMQSIELFIGGYFGPSHSVKADVLKDSIIYECRTGMGYSAEILETSPIPHEAWEKLQKGLIRCDFEYWLDEYIDPNVLDGTSWSVEIMLASGEKITKHGSNQYPGKWKQFCRVISTFTGHKIK